MQMRYFFLFALSAYAATFSVVGVGIPLLGHAESILAPLPGGPVIDRYQRPFHTLSDRERWQTRIHGLRFVPLDPRVWAPLKHDRTDNRTLIPIKRYMLRASEAPGFELQELHVRFLFKPTSFVAMERRPHQHDPIFDVGIGGAVTTETSTTVPKEHFHIVRLSAFPGIRSGIYNEVERRFVLREGGALPQLDTGRSYTVRITCAAGTAKVSIDGEPRAALQEQGLCRGLLSVQTSWHPLYIDTLRIVAIDGSTREPVEVSSGLVPVGAKGGQG